MKIIVVIFFSSFLLFVGCYTILRHPEIEAYYENTDHEQSFVEEFDVIVDEDCYSCHENFQASRHFAPFSPAHQNIWSQTPWWLDDNYKTIFGSPTAPDNDDNYESSESPAYNTTPDKLPPAYIRSPRTTEGEAATRVRKSTDPDSTQTSTVRNETERQKSDSNRRKFRKRN